MGDFEKCKWAETCGHDICIPEYCPEFKAVRINNGDRIRAMTNKELAEIIASNANTGACNDFGIPGIEPCKHNCKKCVLKWLNKPVEE
jgi:hypothetical protein